MICTSNDNEIRALKKYGYYLGMAFQVTDDILDFVADEATLGKPVGSDIRQGVITLPAIYALKYGSNRKQLGKLLSSPQSCCEQAAEIVNLITESDGIDFAYQVSCKYAEKAMQQLYKLKGCEIHSTVILSQVDEKIIKKLGMNLTCEPQYQTKKLYHAK
jgi:heptaprenyl diphosphate synthase